MSFEELEARIAKIERILGLQRMDVRSGEAEMEAMQSTASDHCGNSNMSNHCVLPEVEAAR